MKRIGIILLSVLLLVTSLPSCSSSLPELDDATYDRLVAVIEASVDINTVLFGAGLPVFARDGAEEERLHRYFGAPEDGREYVSVYARYASVEQIKAAVASVYSQSYAASLYETLFTGYATGTSSSILPARYTEDEVWLYQSMNVEPIVTGARFYDYASMEIAPGSTNTYLKINIRTKADRADSAWHESHLSFRFENGNWYLDSPSC